ncbi:hypothetical protein ACS0TY_034064 [Phlomoides rotata]
MKFDQIYGISAPHSSGLDGKGKLNEVMDTKRYRDSCYSQYIYSSHDFCIWR